MLRPDLLELLREPSADDDKYSRGVVGFVTGSESYPGAAILGVTAAMRCGIGMVRYLGPAAVGRLLLEARPEAVLADGRAQAWVLGSGMSMIDDSAALLNHLNAADIAVVDAAALGLIDYGKTPLRTVLTPHAGEAANLLLRFGHEVARDTVQANAGDYAVLLAELTQNVVLLKGHISVIATPTREIREIGPLSSALSTAGTGDVLAGILGSLLAANHDRIIGSESKFLNTIELAILLHSQAADLASQDGPVSALDVAEAIRKVVALNRG